VILRQKSNQCVNASMVAVGRSSTTLRGQGKSFTAQVSIAENRNVRQLVLHRHRLVQMRTTVMNQLQAIAMNEGVRRKRGLWTEQGRPQLEALSLPAWTSRRRQELLELLDRFDLNGILCSE
jgi:transposase